MFTSAQIWGAFTATLWLPGSSIQCGRRLIFEAVAWCIIIVIIISDEIPKTFVVHVSLRPSRRVRSTSSGGWIRAIGGPTFKRRRRHPIFLFVGTTVGVAGGFGWNVNRQWDIHLALCLQSRRVVTVKVPLKYENERISKLRTQTWGTRPSYCRFYNVASKERKKARQGSPSLAGQSGLGAVASRYSTGGRYLRPPRSTR